MKPFDIQTLLLPSFTILALTLSVTYKATRSPTLSIFASLIKAGLFILYFSYFFDGTFTFLDDWTYIEIGKEINAKGIGLTNLDENLAQVMAAGGGEHFLFYLYNAYAMQLFGEGYYAPVAANIILTLPIAWIGSNLIEKEFCLTKNERTLFCGLLLIHPDILAWSCIANIKDILVLFMHVLLLYSGSLILKKSRLQAILIGAPAVLILFFTRFYVPLLFMVSLAANIFATGKTHIKLSQKLIAFIGIGLVIAKLGENGLGYALSKFAEHFTNPAVGFARFILTPIPLNTETSYSFLNLPALFHWLAFPALAIGMYVTHKTKTQFSRLMLTYTFVFTFLYASFGELQGPRHRVQLDFALATFQFLGIRKLLTNRMPSKASTTNLLASFYPCSENFITNPSEAIRKTEKQHD